MATYFDRYPHSTRSSSMAFQSFLADISARGVELAPSEEVGSSPSKSYSYATAGAQGFSLLQKGGTLTAQARLVIASPLDAIVAFVRLTQTRSQCKKKGGMEKERIVRHRAHLITNN